MIDQVSLDLLQEQVRRLQPAALARLRILLKFLTLAFLIGMKATLGLCCQLCYTVTAVKIELCGNKNLPLNYI
jgi:hypothetical protein